MTQYVSAVRDLENERRNLLKRVGEIDKALNAVTAAIGEPNGKAGRPAKTTKAPTKKRERRDSATIKTLKAKIGDMKRDTESTPTQIHQALMASGDLKDNRNDYQLCVRTEPSPSVAMPNPVAPAYVPPGTEPTAVTS